MSSKKRDIKVISWSTGKLMLLTWGPYTLFFLVLFSAVLFVSDPLRLYIVSGFEACCGIALVIYGTVIGGSLYEANRRLNKVVMTKIWRMKAPEVERRLLKMEVGIPYGYNFHVWITRIIGIGLVASSALSFVLYNLK